jgi:hypothetical protein
MRRIEIGMSQQILGQHLGLTFRKIPKYEKAPTASAPALIPTLAVFIFE